MGNAEKYQFAVTVFDNPNAFALISHRSLNATSHGNRVHEPEI